MNQEAVFEACVTVVAVIVVWLLGFSMGSTYVAEHPCESPIILERWPALCEEAAE